MVAELRGRLEDRVLAAAIGVRATELDVIAAGYTPDDDVLERLRLLHRLGGSIGDLRDPSAILTVFGERNDAYRALSFVRAFRVRTFLLAFVLLDALVLGAAVVLFLVLR